MFTNEPERFVFIRCLCGAQRNEKSAQRDANTARWL